MSKSAFIFPGQGAQTCGMGKDFYEHTETGRKVFDKATELLGFSVPELALSQMIDWTLQNTHRQPWSLPALP